MIYMNNPSMLVRGTAVPIIMLTAETDKALYDLRLWPNGMAQRVRNHLVLLTPKELKSMWATPPCHQLDRAQCTLRESAVAYLNTADSLQAKRDAWWRLRKLLDGFNETVTPR